jgi:hypothetical protein
MGKGRRHGDAPSPDDAGGGASDAVAPGRSPLLEVSFGRRAAPGRLEALLATYPGIASGPHVSVLRLVWAGTPVF